MNFLLNKKLRIVIIVVLSLVVAGAAGLIYVQTKNNYSAKHIIQVGEQPIIFPDRYDLRSDFKVFNTPKLGVLEYDAESRKFNLLIDASDTNPNYYKTQISVEESAVSKLGITKEQYCSLVIPVKSSSGLDVGSMICSEEGDEE